MQHAALPSPWLDHQARPLAVRTVSYPTYVFLPRYALSPSFPGASPPPTTIFHLLQLCSPVDLHPALRAQPLPA